MTSTSPDPRQTLLALSHDLGSETRRLAILGEGNTSTRLDAETFLVKASGSSLGTLGENDLVACRFDVLLPLLDASPEPDDAAVDAALLASRVDPGAKKPSVEAVFHAWLLTQPGVGYVAHTHPDEVTALLCSPRAAEFAAQRVFPDEVVCCGPVSLLVPYVDPGLALARAIRAGHEAFVRERGRPPRVILLGSHGVICPGTNAAAARMAMLMTTKAAGIFRRAAALGGPVFMSDADVRRIDGRLDEEHRRRALEGRG